MFVGLICLGRRLMPPPAFFNSHWMNTMYRCLLRATSTVLAAALLIAPAQAQMMRPFPAGTLRGLVTFSDPPVVLLNQLPAQLAPGARIRGLNNGLQLPVSLTGQTRVVHYTQEFNGLIKDIWLLTPEELARVPWPTTAEQARSWSYDAGTQTWTLP